MIRTITDTPKPVKLWLDEIEDGALQQARDLAHLPFVYKWVVLMPDCHQGYGMPIGGVLAAQGAVVPNAVGVDIGCGMCAVRTSLTQLSHDRLRHIVKTVKQRVPAGFRHHDCPQSWQGFDRAPDIPVIQRELHAARFQLGTLGGGNHFIEIQQGDDGRIWLMLHSGSRNFGLKIAQEYHNRARQYCALHKTPLPHKDLAWFPEDTAEAREYLAAMEFALAFAHANRLSMMETLTTALREAAPGAAFEEPFSIHHNYAAREVHYGRSVIVHRKGATSARKGETGIVPGSQGTCSYIVRGKGAAESFMSCSHGAGRRMGRKQAQRTLDLAQQRQLLDEKGIVHGLRTRNDLDEAPGAYKDIDTVMRQQQDLVDIVTRLRPLAVVKG